MYNRLVIVTYDIMLYLAIQVQNKIKNKEKRNIK